MDVLPNVRLVIDMQTVPPQLASARQNSLPLDFDDDKDYAVL
jgi:hypothetical protein